MNDTNKIDDGGPAMPTLVGSGTAANEFQIGPCSAQWYGLSLRDYFAAKAMQALLTNPQYNDHGYDEISAISYGVADYMLAARKAVQS